jgi:hypothetical protein
MILWRRTRRRYQVILPAVMCTGVEAQQGLARGSRLEDDGQEAEDDEDAELRLDTRIAAAQSRATLALHHDGTTDLGKGFFTDGTVAARSLHLHEAPVGREADLAQGGEIGERLPRRSHGRR